MLRDTAGLLTQWCGASADLTPHILSPSMMCRARACTHGPLSSSQVGTFTLFQETYHRPTFKKMHVSGPKSDFEHRLLTQVSLVQSVEVVG